MSVTPSECSPTPTGATGNAEAFQAEAASNAASPFAVGELPLPPRAQFFPVTNVEPLRGVLLCFYGAKRPEASFEVVGAVVQKEGCQFGINTVG
jgi:hypothetical protein